MSNNLAGLPPDARAFCDAAVKLIESYMPGSACIEMMIGPNVKAKLTIEGGSWSKHNLGEVAAHLARYRKYFNDEGAETLNSAEKIMAKLESTLADHRAKQLEARSSTVEPSAHNTPVAGSTPAGPTTYKLDELLSGATEESRHGEVSPDSAVGNEFPNQEPPQ